MSTSIRVLIFNADLDFASELRGHLLSVEGVKIVGEIEDAGMIAEAIERIPHDILLVNLDPEPMLVLALVGDLLGRARDLAVVGISSSTDVNVVLSAMRSGFREFLTRPLDREQLESALRRVMESRPLRQHHGRLVTVIGTIGGVGATTVAVNLGVELADILNSENRPDRVVVVDMDFRFGQVATMLDLQPTYTVADLCSTQEIIDRQMIERTVKKHECGLHVLARPNQFQQADMITAAHCVSLLSALQEIYDYVILDGPSRFDVTARAVLDMADINYLIVQLLVPSVRNAARILEALQLDGYNTERVALVCNRLGREAGQLALEHMEATLNRSVVQSIPDDWKAVSTAINMGEPLVTSFGRSRARAAIRELACKLHNPERKAESGQREGGGKKVAGLLGRWFGDS